MAEVLHSRPLWNRIAVAGDRYPSDGRGKKFLSGFLVIGAVMYQAFMRPKNLTAGRYGDMRTWRKSVERALNSMALNAFPGPGLTDHLTLPFVDLLTRPTFPESRSLIVDQDTAATGTRKFSSFAGMAQTDCAILLASAIAPSIFGLR